MAIDIPSAVSLNIILTVVIMNRGQRLDCLYNIVLDCGTVLVVVLG